MGNSLDYKNGEEEQDRRAQKTIQLKYRHQDKDEVAGHGCEQSAVCSLHPSKTRTGFLLLLRFFEALGYE